MRTAIVAGAALAALLVVACGSSASGGSGAATGPSTTLRVRLTDTGCVPAALDAVAGHVTFAVSNTNSSKATQFVLKDDRGDTLASVFNVLGGLSHDVGVDLAAGHYTMDCGGGGVDGTGVVTIHEPPK